MKTLTKIFLAFVLLGTIGLMKPQQAPAQGVGVSFQLFYDQLSPYGQWVEYPGYSYVWIPDAGPDFSPYATQGHWVLTNFGWTWVSDYPWGWAPGSSRSWARATLDSVRRTRARTASRAPASSATPSA